MSTRQRPMHETTVESSAAVAPLLLARASEPSAHLAEDIGAQRLRELAARLTGSDLQTSDTDDDGDLDVSDTEFEPISLSTILALGKLQTTDLNDDAPVEMITAEPAVQLTTSAREMLPAPTSADTATPPIALAAEDEKPTTTIVEITALEPEEHSALAAVLDAEEDTASALYQPLMLSDQSTPDIRLVDLIRRQQSMLDQLNSFPPSYEALAKQAAASSPVEEAATPSARSVIEQLAPPQAPPAPEPARESPAVLAQLANIRREPMRLQPPIPRESRDEPDASELPQQSPIIIQRAIAERSGRSLPVAAAPPSTVPAFLMGLAAAMVVAGVLFAIL